MQNLNKFHAYSVSFHSKIQHRCPSGVLPRQTFLRFIFRTTLNNYIVIFTIFWWYFIDIFQTISFEAKKIEG